MNKYILVTGATRGLGLEITRTLLEDGYYVVGTGREITEPLIELKNKFVDRLFFEPLDLNYPDKIKDFCKDIHQRYGKEESGSSGRFYGLINNAAVGNDGVLGTMHERDIAELIRVNVESPILLTKYMSRKMLLNGTGRVLNISSIIASTGFSGLSVYGATKAALVGFTKSLSREIGKGGITVNCIAPGFMATDMTQSLHGEKLETIMRRSPMNQLASTSDISRMVAFLMSEEAKSITGTTLTIDAGSTA